MQHEAMSMREDAQASSNTVLQVLQKGYALHGRVIRAAMVIVAS
jgi:molecular chaperone GrpE